MITGGQQAVIGNNPGTWLQLSPGAGCSPLQKRANGIPLNTIEYHWTIQWYFSRTQWYSQW